MAARTLCQKSRMVAYLPNLRSMVRHFRAFSSYDESQPKGNFSHVVVENTDSSLPDPQLGKFEPLNTRFPMPGMVGPVIHAEPPTLAQHVQPPPSATSLIFDSQLPSERHQDILKQFADTINEEREAEAPKDSSESSLECVAQDCPYLLRKDFRQLFPSRNILEGPLTVITLSQHTHNDMSGWSPDVEIEREELLAAFIEGAHSICKALHEAGYWADFIDPSSGRPYLGAYTNSTFYETDERYRHFGFDINDLGCCKVISHHLWGTHAYVGSIFTNAPWDHPVLSDMVKPKKEL